MADNDTYNYMQSGNVKLLPKDASPTDVMDTAEGWRVSGHLPMRNKETKIEVKTTFKDYIKTQEEHVTQY
jgi:hypothetical protein